MDAFVRLLAIIESLPRAVADGEPLRNHLPGAWPTVGDLRSIIENMGPDVPGPEIR